MTLPPSPPLRTAREGFPSSSSSISKGSLQNPVGRFPSTFTILICCQRAFQREAAPANFMAVICFASCVRLPSALVMKDQREVSPLARGGTVLLFVPLQSGVRFLPPPLPPRPSAHLTACFPLWGTGGLTTFRVRINEWGRSRLFAGGVASTVREEGSSYTKPRAVLAQAYQRLWLVGSHDVYQRFTSVDPTIHASSRPP